VSRIKEIEYKCPFCGETFFGWTQISYTIFGINLDFKPYGAAVIPEPVQQCPKCNFVFEKGIFSDTKIKELKIKIKENNIFDDFSNMPPYFYLAKEFELLNLGAENILYYYICTIWQSPNINSFLYSIFLEYFHKLDNSNKNYYKYKLMKIDFLRRQKKFEEARETIKEITVDINFPFSKESAIFLEYQEELIINQDVKEHHWPKEDEKEREENNFFEKIKISIIIDSLIDKTVFEYLQKITLLKNSRLLYKINNNLPIISSSIHTEKILNIITYLKSKNVNATICVKNCIDNFQKNITLSEVGMKEDILNFIREVL
jgi:hypothetical protein